MTPEELPPSELPPDEDSISSTDNNETRSTVTKQGLDKLLARFSPDRNEAAQQYELMRNRLVRFFERRSCPVAEDLADIVINRVARRIDEGQNILNLTGYSLEVARLVFLEWLRPRDRTVNIDDIPEIPSREFLKDDAKEMRLRCLDECLDHQAPESRTLILSYYVDTKRAKINHRRELAEESTLNALRIRACRIRKKLEKCVKDCVKEGQLVRNESGF